MAFISRNRAAVLINPAQRRFKRVLCLCSAGCLRSPTAAVVLAQEPFNFNTRAAGLTKEYAIIPVEVGLLVWANEVVVMDYDQLLAVEQLICDNDFFNETNKPKIINLNIPDIYDYRDPSLMEIIAERYNAQSEAD